MTRLPGLRPEGKTSHEATRQGNRRVLLQLVFDDGPISRADLARATELGRATVSEIVADLIGEGLVVEVGQGTSTGGKPPTLVELDPDGRFTLALDLSTHPIAAALVNLRGRIVASTSGKGVAPRGRDLLEEVHRLVAELIGNATAPALGIGLGVPGAVDYQGRVLRSEQLGWQALSLRDELEDIYGLPTYVATDAEVAAIAEFGRGAATPNTSLLYVKVDDRVSVAVVTDGMLRRTRRRGGDLTHLATESDKRCSCGRRGCLGTEVSVAEILGPDAGGISTEARRRLAAETNPDATNAARILGAAIAPIVAGLDLDMVVVGGQFAEWKDVAAAVSAGIDDSIGYALPVVASQLGQSAVLLGAAGRVLSGELGVVWG
jgi:predicted NBD/HSP70 family sugar kinase